MNDRMFCQRKNPVVVRLLPAVLACLLLASAPAAAQGRCGIAGDSGFFLPLYYTGSEILPPPPLGDPLFDLAFGCPIIRVTDDTSIPGTSGAGHDGGALAVANMDGTLLLAQKASPVGKFIVDGRGNVIRSQLSTGDPCTDHVFPWMKPRWSGIDPLTVYYHSNPAEAIFGPPQCDIVDGNGVPIPANFKNKIFAYDVETDTASEITLSIQQGGPVSDYTFATFGESAQPGVTPHGEADVAAALLDEGDPSLGLGDYVVLSGKLDVDVDTPYTRHRLLNLTTGEVWGEIHGGPSLCPSGPPCPVDTPTGVGIDWCHVAPLSRNLICRVGDPGQGFDRVELFKGLPGEYRGTTYASGEYIGLILPWAGHADQGVDVADTDGDGELDEILVIVNSSHSRVQGNGCFPPGIEKVRIPDGLRTCLIDDIYTGAAHVSVNQTVDQSGTPSHGWTLVSTYENDGTQYPEPGSGAPAELPANWADLWRPFDNELFLVALDGSQFLRLAHHRNRDPAPLQPFPSGESMASLDRNAGLAVFGSDFATVPGVPDVYAVPLPIACDADGQCDPGENCRSCTDCAGSPTCGDGVCEAIELEDCLSCAADCNGVTSGKPADQFCCGPVLGPDGFCSADPNCNSGSFQCSDDEDPTRTFCCGDGVCGPLEDATSCATDCATVTASSCPAVTPGAEIAFGVERELFVDGPGVLGDNYIGIPAFSPVNLFPNDGQNNGFQQLCDIFGLRGTASSITQFDAKNGTVTTFLCNQAVALPFQPCQGVLIRLSGVPGPVKGTIPVSKTGPGVEGSWTYEVYGNQPGVLGDHLFGIPLTITSLNPETLCQELNLPAGSQVLQFDAGVGTIDAHNCGQLGVSNLVPGSAVLIQAPGGAGQLVATGQVTID